MPPSNHDSQKVALEIKSFSALFGTKYSTLHKVQVRYIPCCRKVATRQAAYINQNLYM